MMSHPDLHLLKERLRSIHESLSNFRPLSVRPPILDSSTESDSADDAQWLQQENIPGLKQLRDTIKIDLDVLERFLDDPNSINLPPLSTNAPYLIAVYNEVLCAPPPIVSILSTLKPAPAASVKVDVVADGGRRWIRVNTIKNTRMMAEFREIDSYFTDSDDSDDDRPSLAQKEFDNSVLRMGRALVAAANANHIDGPSGPQPPKITMRLTRLDPSEPSANESDPRISQTIACLRALGIDIELGERAASQLPVPKRAEQPIALAQLVPTANINLDLSVLIALVSDLTHAPLPTSLEEAHRRYTAPPRASKSEPQSGRGEQQQQHEGDPTKQARALTSQILQEMLQEMGKGGFFQELHDRLRPLLLQPTGAAASPVRFWTTREARDRFVRIVSTIGGPGERRRAEALFAAPDVDADAGADAGAQEQRFWAGSRFAAGFIPVLPVRVYPDPPLELELELGLESSDGAPRAQFFRAMERTCRGILAQETPTPTPTPTPSHTPSATSAAAGGPQKRNEGEQEQEQAQEQQERVQYSQNAYRRNRDVDVSARAPATRRLTAHTVRSMLGGARRGWTTLTANRGSVRALVRGVGGARVGGRGAEALREEDEEVEGVGLHEHEREEEAAVWIVDPRSLAEGVRARVAAESVLVNSS